MKYYVTAALKFAFSSQYYKNTTSGMNELHYGKYSLSKDCYYLSFLRAYTKMPIVSGLIISVNKVIGSDGVDRSVLRKQKPW